MLGRQADSPEMPPRRVVIAEGERGEAFLVVMSGSLAVTRRVIGAGPPMFR